MLSVRQVAMVLAVLAIACGGEPRPVPRAVGTVIIEPPLDPATEAEVMRSRTVAEIGRASCRERVSSPV